MSKFVLISTLLVVLALFQMATAQWGYGPGSYGGGFGRPYGGYGGFGRPYGGYGGFGRPYGGYGGFGRGFGGGPFFG
ncbi:hypothetical protein AAVH_31735 [Aphelenchoides avenae]|nr:hypothetical protein AAVH_31735 [Aphelenchus avenae]